MKRSLRVVTVFFVVITVIFLWKEPLSFSKPINGEKAGAYATALAAVFTAFTVYLLFDQNKHLREEKKLEIQPDLYPAEESFLVTTEKETIAGVNYTDVKFLNARDISPTSFGTSGYFKIKLHNIGLGVAKTVSYHWVYENSDVNQIIGCTSSTEPESLPGHIDFIPSSNSALLQFPFYYAKCLAPEFNAMGIDHDRQTMTLAEKQNLPCN